MTGLLSFPQKGEETVPFCRKSALIDAPPPVGHTEKKALVVPQDVASLRSTGGQASMTVGDVRLVS